MSLMAFSMMFAFAQMAADKPADKPAEFDSMTINGVAMNEIRNILSTELTNIPKATIEADKKLDTVDIIRMVFNLDTTAAQRKQMFFSSLKTCGVPSTLITEKDFEDLQKASEITPEDLARWDKGDLLLSDLPKIRHIHMDFIEMLKTRLNKEQLSCYTKEILSYKGAKFARLFNMLRERISPYSTLPAEEWKVLQSVLPDFMASFINTIHSLTKFDIQWEDRRKMLGMAVNKCGGRMTRQKMIEIEREAGVTADDIRRWDKDIRKYGDMAKFLTYRRMFLRWVSHNMDRRGRRCVYKQIHGFLTEKLTKIFTQFDQSWMDMMKKIIEETPVSDADKAMLDSAMKRPDASISMVDENDDDDYDDYEKMMHTMNMMGSTLDPDNEHDDEHDWDEIDHGDQDNDDDDNDDNRDDGRGYVNWFRN